MRFQMNTKKRFIWSLIIAPLFAPVTMFLILVFYIESIERFIPTKSTGWLASFEIVMSAGALVSYVFTIILGLPLYFIFKRLGLINYWTLSIGGTSIASIPFVLMGLSEGLKRAQENLSVFVVLAACGFAVGNAFYFINNWGNSNLNAREGR
jgi:ABC-type spermidine/putrescine transport system permease subunit II